MDSGAWWKELRIGKMGRQLRPRFCWTSYWVTPQYIIKIKTSFNTVTYAPVARQILKATAEYQLCKQRPLIHNQHCNHVRNNLSGGHVLSTRCVHRCYKLNESVQTRVLVREGSPQKQDRKFQTATYRHEVISGRKSHNGARRQDILPDSVVK
jgi:hypothetical protein